MSRRSAIKCYNIGLQYAKSGNLDDAIEFLKTAIARDPKYVNSYNVLGKVYIQKGDVRSARACWRKTLTIDPKNVTASQCLSSAKTKPFQIQFRTLLWLIAVFVLLVALVTNILVSCHHITDLKAKLAKTAMIRTDTSSEMSSMD